MEKMKNLPTDHKKFSNCIRSIDESMSKLKKARTYLSEFSGRYRLAKSFQGLLIEDFQDRTIYGYTEVIKLFLSYTAFERVHKCAFDILKVGSKKKIKSKNNFEIRVSEKILNKVRKNKKLHDFMVKKLSSGDIQKVNEKNIENFFSGKNNDINYLVTTLRHSFAHGHLAATTIATNKTEAEGLRALSEEILKASDQLFSQCVEKLEYENDRRK